MAYHKDFPEGKLFVSEADYNEAMATGEWGNAPYDIPELQVPPDEPEMKPWQKAQTARKAKQALKEK